MTVPTYDSPSGGGVTELYPMLATDGNQHLLRNVVTTSKGPNTWNLHINYAPEYARPGPTEVKEIPLTLS